jgi:hypothetical protein
MLYAAAVEEMTTDWSFLALNMSRVTSPDLLLKRLSYYRDDIVDFSFELGDVFKLPAPAKVPAWLQATCLKWEM